MTRGRNSRATGSGVLPSRVRLDEPTMRASLRRLGLVVEEVVLLRMMFATMIVYLQADEASRRKIEPNLAGICEQISRFYKHEGADVLNRLEVDDADVLPQGR